MNREVICFDAVAPARERGLKFEPMGQSTANPNVAPARERGLKLNDNQYIDHREDCRSREGAWIEIKASERYGAETANVAPARERGLKY